MDLGDLRLNLDRRVELEPADIGGLLDQRRNRPSQQPGNPDDAEAGKQQKDAADAKDDQAGATQRADELVRVGDDADADEFVGPLRRASLVILGVGRIFLLFACLGVVWVSRLLTRPIAALIEEAADIRRLELDSPVEVESKIAEIHSLAQALAATKSALRSFGRYVPKELVREIVREGSDSALGGGRQPVTILFTDLV